MQENEEKVLKFDKGLRKTIDGEEFAYGILLGNEKIVFIKAGAGESHLGRENRYLKMAHSIRDRLGATVICASNDSDEIALDKKILKKYIEENTVNNGEVYFVGFSDGAYKNLFLAKCFEGIKKMLFINPSYIYIEDFVEKLNAFSNVEKILVYGTHDGDSYRLVKYLSDRSIDNLQVNAVEGANHKFKGKLDEFISLVDLI